MIFDKLKLEFFGTFLSVYFSGLLLIQQALNNIDIMGMAIGFFAVWQVLIWTTHSKCGSHFNPVISLSLVATGHMKLHTALLYTLFQFCGSFGSNSMAIAWSASAFSNWPIRL